MGTLKPYRRYLQRLKERRNDPFYQKQAKFLIRSTAPEYHRTAEQYENYLNREDLPESLKAQATINQQQNCYAYNNRQCFQHPCEKIKAANKQPYKYSSQTGQKKNVQFRVFSGLAHILAFINATF